MQFLHEAPVMLDDTLTNPSAADLERLRREALTPSQRIDVISYDWARIGMGIALAGGAYPLVLATIFAAFGAITFVWSNVAGYQNGPRLSEGIEVVVMLLVYSFVSGLIGVLWSGFVTVLTLPVIYLVAWSLSLQTSIVRLGAFAGGLVGFICVLPLTLSVPWVNFGGDVWQIVFVVSLGPMLATVLGQLGGTWGGSKSRELGPAHAWQQSLVGSAAPEPADGEPSDGHGSDRPRLQFGIRHLLWISVWLSLLLALIRICGIPFELILPLLICWLLFQSAAMWAGGLLVQKLVQWRAQRQQFRST
jgi:hypothetical protein